MSELASEKRHRNPDWWSVTIAALALVVSLIQPVRSWFAEPKLVINCSDTLGVSHVLGDISFLIPTRLENLGGNKVTVSQLHVRLRRSGTTVKEWNLHAKGYLMRQNPISGVGMQIGFPAYPFTELTLRPGESWAEIMLFKPQLDSETVIAATRIISQADKVARKLAREQRIPPGYPVFAPLEEQTKKDAAALFERTFDLTEGSYELFLAAKDNYGRVLTATGSRFSIHSVQNDVLRSTGSDYATSADIAASVASPIQITMHNWIPEKQAMDAFK